MTPETVAIGMFIALALVIFLGHPLAFSLGVIGMVFGILGLGDVDVVMNLMATRAYGVMKDYVLVAVPLFIFMAQILDASGVADHLFHSLHIVLGPLRGGLALAVLLVCTVFAASSGVVGACVVGIGLLAVPALIKRGYDMSLTAGVITAGGTLGILIPPSIMLIVYGSLMAMSVGQLYAAAMFPGLLLSAIYIAYVLIICAVKPELGPPMAKEERTYSAAQQLKMVVVSLVPITALVLVVLGSIIVGLATPTEAAGLGVAGAFLLTAAYGKLNWAGVKKACISTFTTNAMVMILFLGGNAFQSVFMMLGGGDAIANMLLGLEVNRYVILFIMMVILFFLGMFIDWVGILLICLPIFTPIAIQLDFHPLWFATLVCVNLQMAFLTPPFGYSLFYLKGIAPPEMSVVKIYKGVVPFVSLQWVGLLLCIFFPDIVLYLPRLFFGADAVK